MRGWLVCVALAAAPAFAGTPERDKTWDALIAEAKKHGGEETQYKTSASYVFRKSDGEYVTLTKMTDSSTRAVCAISKDQTVTVCGNWDTGKLRYGWRADADAAWTYGDTPPEDQKGGVFGSLLSGFSDILQFGAKNRRRSGGD